MKLWNALWVCGVLTVPAVGHAQEDELRETTVVVTAPGPDRAAGELISHATRLGREDIVSSLSGTLGDTLDKQPGVSTTYFGSGASRPVLRGLGAERVLVLTNGLGVVDVSAASPDHQVTGDGIDAQAIEILRGPAALAYGGQAIGGVVNVIDGLIVTSAPEDGVTGQFFGATNSVNDGTEGSARLQFSQNGFYATFSASGRDFGSYDVPGFIESARQRASEPEEEFERGLVENSFLKTSAFSGSLGWASDKTYLGFAVRKTTSEYGLPGHSHAHEHEDDHDQEGDEDDHAHDDADHEGDDHEHEEESPFIDMDQTRVDVKFGIRLDGDFWKKIEASLSASDYEHTEFEGVGEPGTVYKTDGVEFRTEADHAFGGFEGAFGLQYSDVSFEAFGEESFISPTDTQSFGLFVYETRDWSGGIGIEGGLRFENVSYQNDVNGDVDFDLFSASFGAHKHWASGWFIGGQLSLTERAPNQSELFADGAHLATRQYEVGRADMEKETGLNIEGTVRWEGASSHICANVFFTDFSDFIYLTPGEILHDGALVDEVDELAVWLFSQRDAEFTGFELIGEHAFGQQFLNASWSAKGNIDFVKAELSDGSNVPYIPPMTVNAGLSADWGAIKTDVSATWAAEQNDSGVGVLDTDSYTTLDVYAEADLASLIGAPEGLTAFADLRNITDEEVRYATSVLKDLLPAPGRNVRIGAKFSF